MLPVRAQRSKGASVHTHNPSGTARRDTRILWSAQRLHGVHERNVVSRKQGSSPPLDVGAKPFLSLHPKLSLHAWSSAHNVLNVQISLKSVRMLVRTPDILVDLARIARSFFRQERFKEFCQVLWGHVLVVEFNHCLPVFVRSRRGDP